MTNRPKVPLPAEDDVFERSRERCAACFFRYDDLRVKRGQLAHVNHNKLDMRAANLVFLCRKHHEDYDTPRPTTKRVSARRMRMLRQSLYEAIDKKRHTLKDQRAKLVASPKKNAKRAASREGTATGAGVRGDGAAAHDREVFAGHNDLFSEKKLLALLRDLDTDQDFEATLHKLCEDLPRRIGAPENRFVDDALQEAAERFAEALFSLWRFMVTRYFPPPGPGRLSGRYVHKDVPANGLKDKHEERMTHNAKLGCLVNSVRAAYVPYRALVKKKLYV